MSGADIVRKASEGLSVCQSPVQQISGSCGRIKAILQMRRYRKVDKCLNLLKGLPCHLGWTSSVYLVKGS